MAKNNNVDEQIVGIGLRHQHYDIALSPPPELIPSLPNFIEIHAENFFAKGGISQQLLHDIKQRYPISIHGTSLGLGSLVPPSSEVLSQFSTLVEQASPILVSEHLCFNRALVGEQLLHSGDLLPIAFNAESLHTCSNNIQLVQNSIGRPLLLENLSAYLSVDSHDLEEYEFFLALCKQAGCGILLDINNLLINAYNSNHKDPIELVSAFMKKIPANLVGEIHLAGYTEQAGSDLIIDDHGNFVSDDCWTLLSLAKKLYGTKPTLVEWDTNIPEFSVLLNEAMKARRIESE